VGDLTARYAVIGVGPPLVLLHGYSCSVDWWSRNLAALSRYFRVYALDLLYRRDGRKTPDFTLREATQHIVGWMQAAGLEKASFIGHSMGGFIAASVAADSPQSVEKLMLVSAALLPAEWMKLSPLELLRCAPWIPLGVAPLLVRDALRTGPRRLLRTGLELLMSDLRPKLARIEAPTLIVWGGRDGILPVRLGQELHEAVVGSRFELLERAGHIPMWEEPQQFNELALSFLNSRAAAAERSF
jgi:pimeloyl-ACP methyl ester carboxylesterase